MGHSLDKKFPDYDLVQLLVAEKNRENQRRERALISEHPVLGWSESTLIQKHGAVEGVALDWFEAGVANDAAQFFFRGAVTGAGGFDYIFF